MDDQRELIIKTTEGALEAGGTGNGRGSVLFVGAATVLIRYAGFTVLTDPDFLRAGEHARLGFGMASERLIDPAFEIDELPPLDLCVLSHLHGDHFDRAAERQLRRDLPIVTTRQAAKELPSRGFSAAEGLDEWEQLVVRKGDARLTVTALPARHGPPVAESLLPDVMGSMLEFAGGASAAPLRLYITGATIFFDGLAAIAARFPDIDLEIVHGGGTRILGMLLTYDADQAVEAMKLIPARTYIPVHLNDYEAFKSPARDLQVAVKAAGLEDQVRFLQHGEVYRFSAPRVRVRAA